MARKLRVEYPGAVYHVMNRGDRRELIFMDDADRQRFVETLGEACAKTGWLHAALDFKLPIADCRSRISALCFPNFCFSLRLCVFALKVFCMVTARRAGESAGVAAGAVHRVERAERRRAAGEGVLIKATAGFRTRTSPCTPPPKAEAFAQSSRCPVDGLWAQSPHLDLARLAGRGGQGHPAACCGHRSPRPIFPRPPAATRARRFGCVDPPRTRRATGEDGEFPRVPPAGGTRQANPRSSWRQSAASWSRFSPGSTRRAWSKSMESLAPISAVISVSCLRA